MTGFTSIRSMPMALVVSLASAPTVFAQLPTPDFTTSEAGNPFIDGWYADPDTEYYNDEYWIFPTWSDVYERQTHLDAFSSPDLVHWTKHANIITADDVSWAHKAMWAPAAIERNGKYYLYFGANDIQQDEIADGLIGGIGVAVADKPEGPYQDALGEPLIGNFHNGAQPIDQDVFIDEDGQAYMYYGGHNHANVAKLNEDMISLGTFDDNTTFLEVTPSEEYVEGSQMFKRNGVYYFMWSEGGWTGPDYAVSYAMSDNPLGPFEPLDRLLEQDEAVARGSGHNGVINVPGTDIWYMTYHRRPLSETDGNHRVTCYDRMYFNEDGTIQPIQMLVKDNFADDKMIAWNTSGSAGGDDDWNVFNMTLEGTASSGAPALAFLDTNFADVDYNVTISADDYAEDDALIVFRATSVRGGDYYWARLRPDKAEIGKTTAEGDAPAQTEVLAEGQGEFEGGKTYPVRVRAVGSEIELYVADMEGDPVVSVTDDSRDTGANGVAVVSGSARFGAVSVARP